MRYKPERALTHFKMETIMSFTPPVEMRYKPERALTPLETSNRHHDRRKIVEMRYKPERALTQGLNS